MTVPANEEENGGQQTQHILHFARVSMVCYGVVW